MNILEGLAKYCSLTVQEEDGYIKNCCFDADFIGFAGHFPGNPVLPAFVQLLMARIMAEEAREASQNINIKSAKFIRSIRPGEKVTMRLKRNVVEIKSDGELAAIIRTRA